MKLNKRWGKLIVAAGLGLSLVAAGCGADTEEDPNANGENEAPEANEDNAANENADNAANENGEENGDAAGAEVDLTEITGIDAGAGIMAAAEEAIEVYDLDLELTPSSDAAMMAALEDAIDNEEDIVITGWTPHWKFGAYDIKYLDDPEGVFGEAESIHTLVRLGLADDHPSAYTVLDNFQWEEEDMNEVMVAINQEDEEPYDAAEAWIEANRDTVDGWIEGVDSVDSDELELVYVNWVSEEASTHVVGTVLEEVGYEVELTPIEAGAMFSGLAAGDADGMVAAWLPATHADYYEQYADEFEDLGPNLEEGAAIGLVVPEYMDIDSITDLPSN